MTAEEKHAAVFRAYREARRVLAKAALAYADARAEYQFSVKLKQHRQKRRYEDRYLRGRK